jgi:hypothetical protein
MQIAEGLATEIEQAIEQQPPGRVGHRAEDQIVGEIVGAALTRLSDW